MGRIKEARKMLNGHLGIEFEDGTQVVVPRGEHESLSLKPGDEYPPVVVVESESTQEESESLEFEELADEEAEEDSHPDKPKRAAKKSHTKKK